VRHTWQHEKKREGEREPYIDLEDVFDGEGENGGLERLAVGGNLEDVGEVAPVGLDVETLVREVVLQDVQQHRRAARHQVLSPL
jgi:hypothetical protein